LASITSAIASGLADTLAGGSDMSASRSARHALIQRVVALDGLIDEAIGEDSDLRYRSRTLQAGVEGLFATLSAWRGVANLLDTMRDNAARSDAVSLGSMVSRAGAGGWLDNPGGARTSCGHAATHVLTMPATTPSARFLVDRVAEALLGLHRTANALVLLIAPGQETAGEGGQWLLVPDILPALVNGLRCTAATLAAEALWVGTSWSGGQAVVTFTAVAVTVFSPGGAKAYRNMLGYLAGTVIAAVAATLVNFAVLPAQDGFLGFSLALACILVPFGAPSAGPWDKALYAAVTINFLAILAPQNQPNYDLGQFLNSALPVVVGTFVAAIFSRLIPPVSPAWRTRRLLALTLRDLQRLTSRRRWLSRADWTRLMSWRLGTATDEATPEQLARLVAALSVGEAVIHLRNNRPRLAAREALDRALAALAALDTAAVRYWLSRFGVQQPNGEGREALTGMRGRAAATVISDALTRHSDFFDATRSSVR
jgi:hypothetical protein